MEDLPADRVGVYAWMLKTQGYTGGRARPGVLHMCRVLRPSRRPCPVRGSHLIMLRKGHRGLPANAVLVLQKDLYMTLAIPAGAGMTMYQTGFPASLR